MNTSIILDHHINISISLLYTVGFFETGATDFWTNKKPTAYAKLFDSNFVDQSLQKMDDLDKRISELEEEIKERNVDLKTASTEARKDLKR